MRIAPIGPLMYTLFASQFFFSLLSFSFEIIPLFYHLISGFDIFEYCYPIAKLGLAQSVP